MDHFQPAGPDLDEGAVAELPALGVFEQRALYRGPHTIHSIAHLFDQSDSPGHQGRAADSQGAETVLAPGKDALPVLKNQKSGYCFVIRRIVCMVLI